MDVFVVKVKGLRVEELNGKVPFFVEPHGKELMHKHAWMALEAACQCYSFLEEHLLYTLPI